MRRAVPLPLSRSDGVFVLLTRLPRSDCSRSHSLTISHFPSRDAAEKAKLSLSWTPVTFNCDSAIHVMRRLGGDGQFERCCTLRVGGGSMQPPPPLIDPPLRFESMLREEAEWMRETRRASYALRGKRGRRRPRRTAEERAAIASRTPEEIALIRAARAEKRARMDQAAAEHIIDGN